jgi:hypothetical protein
MILLSCVFHCTLMLAFVIFHSTDTLDLCSSSLTGTIPSEVSFLTKLSELSVCLVACWNDCVMCFSLYPHACLSFFILQLGWISTAIV